MLAYTAVRPRIDLASALPLDAPMALFVEPTNVCNFKCSFCPESLPDFAARSGYYQHMTMETWGAVLSSLRSWPKMKVVRFPVEGEPLLHKHLPKMIADIAPYAERTVVTTNGSLVGRRASELIESGLDYLRVSVYAVTDAQYSQVTGTRATVNGIRDGVARLRVLRGLSERPYVDAELVMENPTSGDVQLFREQWQGIADETSMVETLHNWGGGDSRLVSIGSPQHGRKVCPQPFYQLAIKANGEVSVCCADWDNRLVVGNLQADTLQDIWSGPALRRIQETHLRGARGEIPSCANCTAFYKYPDNLDHLVSKQAAGLAKVGGIHDRSE